MRSDLRSLRVGLVVPLICLSTFGLTGCSEQQELAGNLDTQQSVELMVALRGVGIVSARERTSSGREASYMVTVSGNEYLRALQVMHEYRLPSERREQFEELTAPKGLIPNTPEMNKLRLDHAMAIEVERVVASLPGILDVKAVVRSLLTDDNSGSSLGSTPSVALVIRYLSPSGNIPFDVDEIKNIVMKVIPGASAEAISVNATRIFFPISALEGEGDVGQGSSAAFIQLRPFPFRVVASERLKAYAQIGTLLLGATLSGIVLGVAAVMSSRKQRKRAKLPAADPRGMVPEVVSRSGPPGVSEYGEGTSRRRTGEF